MNILEKITAHKRQEVEARKASISIRTLEKSDFFARQPLVAADFIRNGTGIIAEFKRQSPSKGIIHPNPNLTRITQGYAVAGASAISVLTDTAFFGGTDEDLKTARRHLDLPLLRKDFMIDAYQIIEAKALGADIILLIAAALPPKMIKELGKLAQSLDMSVLLEVHSLEELERSLCQYLNLVGVNNRNLSTFEVSLAHSYQILPHIPDDFVKISESGISDPATVKMLKQAGFEGFLIGENFMKTPDPAAACHDFLALL